MQSPEQVRPRSVWLISWSVIALCLINLAGGLFSWTVSSVQEGTPAGADAPWLPSILSIVCVLAATALLAGTAVGMLRGNRWSRAVFLWSVPLLGLAGYALYGLDVSLSTAGVWLCLYVVSFFILLGPAESAYFKGRGDGAVQARPMRTGWVPAAILLVGTPAMYLAATALWGLGLAAVAAKNHVSFQAALVSIYPESVVPMFPGAVIIGVGAGVMLMAQGLSRALLLFLVALASILHGTVLFSFIITSPFHPIALIFGFFIGATCAPGWIAATLLLIRYRGSPTEV